jgi:hypothetical protein
MGCRPAVDAGRASRAVRDRQRVLRYAGSRHVFLPREKGVCAALHCVSCLPTRARARDSPRLRLCPSTGDTPLCLFPPMRHPVGQNARSFVTPVVHHIPLDRKYTVLLVPANLPAYISPGFCIPRLLILGSLTSSRWLTSMDCLPAIRW